MSLLDRLTKSLVDVYASKLNDQEKAELLQSLEILANDQKYNKLANYLPDTGEFRRELYPKHVDLMNAGSRYRERFALMGNRTGKSEMGAAETTYHATGRYPDWWEGRRYAQPVLIWVGGDTATTCRDIVQKKLMGEVSDIGSGMIPKEDLLIEQCKTRRNVPDAYEILRVKHLSGGISTIVIKTYEQGRATWQGSEVDFIWIDEECPDDVYGEARVRLMTTKGCMLTTFTPLKGVTPLVLMALENSQETESKFPVYVQTCSWDEAPHITPEIKEEELAKTPPQLRDARAKGIPTVGDGLVYPIDHKDLVVADFPIPKHYAKLYGMDVGWNCTSAVWGAWDRDNDIIYIYSEHKQGQAEPVVHAKAIKGRGEWIKGVIDPASRGRSQVDGEALYALYRREGLLIYPADNAVEAGILEVWERMTTGRLKIFKSCTQLLRELTLYRRENGKIKKENDHAVDGMRYLIHSNKNLWGFPQSPQKQERVVDFRQYMKGAV